MLTGFPALTAIKPRRFVQLAAGPGLKHADSDDATLGKSPPVGISQEFQRYAAGTLLADGFAAKVGASPMVYDTPGQVCWLEIGSTTLAQTIVPGDALAPDIDGTGRGVKAASAAGGAAGSLIYYGAIAIDGCGPTTAAADDGSKSVFIRVEIQKGLKGA